MNIKNQLKNLTIFVLTTFALVSVSTAQSAAPRQEKLLNGLKLLIWNEPAAKASVRLRVHSGAAFDTLGREGTMALLADILFPNPSINEFFSEELGGALAVESNYDYIQISGSGDSDKILTILETLAAAVTKPAIDKETTARVKAARLEKIKVLENDPAYLADRAAANRLFGNYPYGRTQAGTAESVGKTDFADLLLAKQRFLTADNATLAISGNVKPEYVFKVVRQLFGGWEKADRRVPATFAQPDAPEAKEFSIELPNAEKDSRISIMTVAARGDKDFYATKILTEIWREQFCLDAPERSQASYKPYLLRGIYFISFVSSESSSPAGRNPCQLMLLKDGKILYPPILQSDFEKAKSKIVAELSRRTLSPVDAAELWLDADTYRLGTVKDETQRANAVTLADVQRVAESLQKQSPVFVNVKKSVAVKQ